MFHRAGGFHSFRGAPDARAHKVCSIAPVTFSSLETRWTREDAASVLWLLLSANWQHNQKREGRPRPFCGFPVPRLFLPANRQHNRNQCAGRGRIACPIADTKCLSSHRNSSPFCGTLDARGREACFTAPEVFIHSVARRTREHTKCVPSRQSLSPLWKRAGRERTPHPFYGFFCLRIGSTIKNVRGRLVRSAAFPAPRFSDLISSPGGSPFCEPGERGRSCMPFRLAFDCPPQIFCRFLKNIFGFLHSGRQHSSNKPGAEAPRLKDFLFHNHLPKTRQLRFILHAFGTRPVRIRAPRPIGP